MRLILGRGGRESIEAEDRAARNGGSAGFMGSFSARNPPYPVRQGPGGATRGHRGSRRQPTNASLVVTHRRRAGAIRWLTRKNRLQCHRSLLRLGVSALSDRSIERLIHDEGDGTFVVWPHGRLGSGYRVSARRKDHFRRAKKVAIWAWIILPPTAAIAFDLNFWQFIAVCVSIYLIERAYFRWLFRGAETTSKRFPRSSPLEELRAMPLALQYVGFLTSLFGFGALALVVYGREPTLLQLLMVLATGVTTVLCGYLVVTNKELGGE